MPASHGPDMPGHARREPEGPRAALMRRAGDLIGSERLARELGMSSRNLYWLMNGRRNVKDQVLADTRKILIRHRQAIGDLVQDIRAEEAATPAAEETNP